MRRFNEATDQAIAESLAQFTREVEGARDRFLAVLGHDLRSPLGAILTSSRFPLDEGHLSDMQQRMIASMEKSGQRMAQLVEDLLDLAMTRFGSSIPLRRTSVDLNTLLREVIAEVGASSPDAQIEFATEGTLIGEWDRTRLAQAFANLLSSAIRHGVAGMPIKVTATTAGENSVEVAFRNEGPAIPGDQVKRPVQPNEKQSR